MNGNHCPAASTSGGTGAVSAGRGGALPASATEQGSGAGTVIQQWPLVTELPLAALATAPGCARGHVRSVAHEWGLADLCGTAELLASELVTNAVQASQRFKASAGLAVVPPVKLWVTSDRTCMVLHVWDANPEMPVLEDFAADDENGRGLFLVEALSKDCGWYQKADGKLVWCLITADT